jgi:hypothetical protein
MYQQSSASAAEFGSPEFALQSPEFANSSFGKWLPTLCLLSRGVSLDCHLTTLAKNSPKFHKDGERTHIHGAQI